MLSDTFFFPGGFILVWEGKLRLNGYISILVKCLSRLGELREMSSYTP